MQFSRKYWHAVEEPSNNALNCRSLRSLDVQKLRFWLPVSIIVSPYN